MYKLLACCLALFCVAFAEDLDGILETCKKQYNRPDCAKGCVLQIKHLLDPDNTLNVPTAIKFFTANKFSERNSTQIAALMNRCKKLEPSPTTLCDTGRTVANCIIFGLKNAQDDSILTTLIPPRDSIDRTILADPNTGRRSIVAELESASDEGIDEARDSVKFREARRAHSRESHERRRGGGRDRDWEIYGHNRYNQHG